MAFWFPLAPNVSLTPPADIRTFAPTLVAGMAYGLLAIGLFILYLAACRAVSARGLGRFPLMTLLAMTLLLALPLLGAYPINATDVVGYVIRGRIASIYGESPFSSPADMFVGDPFMPLVAEWASETTPYGPLWEIAASRLTALSGDDLLAGVLLFKGLALLCFIITAALIWHLLPAGRRLAYTALWAWNPVLLLLFVMDGHNDSVMLMWLVLGYWLARRGRPAAGFLVMVLAVLTKMIAMLALPFFFLAFVRKLPAGRQRFLFSVMALIGALAIAWLLFLPWSGAEGSMRTPLNLILRLIREATGGAGFSPAVWVYMALGGRVSVETIGVVAQSLFAGFTLLLLLLAVRGRSVLRGVADVFYGYLVSALNFRIWYASWSFPWLVLDAGEVVDGQNPSGANSAAYRLRVGLWFLLTSQLSVVVYGHIRVFVLGGDQAAAHLLGVPFVFGLPWLLALIPWRLSRPVHAA